MKTKSMQRLVAAVLAFVMVLSWVPFGSLQVNAVTNTYTFDATALTPELDDRVSIGDGVKVGDNDYFTIVGNVQKRPGGGVVSYVELAKQEGGKISFTVTGSADVTLIVSSTGSQNTSDIALKNASGNVVANNEGISSVQTTTKATLTYTGLAAGTYYVCAPAEGTNSRATRLYSVSVTQNDAATATTAATEATEATDATDATTGGASTAGKIDVWDFGAEQLDTSIYNNMLDVDEINSWFPGIEPGTSGTPLLGFTSSDGQLVFEANGKTNNRLRTTNTALCRHDAKSLTDANGVVYSGYVYSNSSKTDKVYLAVQVEAGDIITIVAGSNGGDSEISFEGPSGIEDAQTYLASGAKGQIMTFYPAESGMYKFYSLTEKLVIARIYREHTNAVTVSGNVNAPDGLSGYSIVFTNQKNGAVVEAPVSGGTYSAQLKDCYTYDVSLKDANGYIITSEKTLTVEKGAASASLDVNVIAVAQVTITGSITGLSAEALGKVSIDFVSDAVYVPEVKIDGSTYTVKAEVGVEYDVVVSGINDYELTSAAKVTYTEDGTADITFAEKAKYDITIVPEGATLSDLAGATVTFTNLNEEGYAYSFVIGTDAIALRDGVYSVKVTNSGIYVQQLTSNLKVNGAAASKTIRFSSDITVWNFRADEFTGQSPYNGLEITGSFGKHSTNYGMNIKNATIKVPVPGNCEVKVSVGYNWDISFEDEAEGYFDNTNSGDIDIPYTYTGSAGYVTIHVGGECTSYIKQIEIIESTAYKATVTVGASGCDYTTINDALDAVRAMPRPNGERVTIEIQPGNYEEMLVIDVPNVSLVNASANPSIELINKGVDIDANAVRITSYYGHGYTYYSMGSDCKWDETILAVNKENGYASFTNPGSGSTSGSYWNATVVVSASGFQAEGIIFENSFNQYVSEKAANDVIVAQNSAKEPASAPRASLAVGSTAVQNKAYVERAAALAITDNVKQASFDNCKFVGRQDTLYGGKGATAAFYDCSIYGACDYIFGGMTAVFAKCDLVFNTSEDGNDVGYITAAQTPSGSHGMLMYNCTVTSTTPGVDTASEYTSKPGYFGRPWQAATGEAVFYYTVIDATDTNWYAISPSLIRDAGWLSTLSGESALCGEYGTFEYAVDVDNSANRASWAAVFTEEKLASGEAIAVETFLGSWDAFAGKDMTIEIPSDNEKVDNKPVDDTPGGEPTVYVLDTTLDMSAFAQGAKADGDSELFKDYFTVMYSAKNKVDGSNKSFDDGYTATQRLNFGGKTDPGKGMINSIKFTTANSATVKIWWVSGGDGREFAIYNSAGEVLNKTAEGSVKNSLYISELTVDAAGTYYLGVPDGSNYLFKLEVAEDAVLEDEEFVLDTTLDLSAFAQGAKADGDSELFKDYFTVMYSAKNKVDGSNKSFDDGYTATQRLNFGGKTDPGKGMINSVKFTTSRAATVKIWWVSGGDGREFAIYNSAGEVLNKTAEGSVKNSLYISELSIDAAGTYYLGVPDGSNYLFKLMVTETGTGSAEPERADWATVADPVISGVADGENEGEISVTVSAVIGLDGGDEVIVTMYDAEGNEIASKRSIAEKAEHTVAFAPTASGKYTFKAVLTRAEETEKTSAEASFDFSLPLETPVISSVTSLGGGSVGVVWGEVPEAESYDIYRDGAKVGSSATTSFTDTGLALDTEYFYAVVAVRGEDESAKSDEVKVITTAEAQRVWSFLRYGPSTNDNNNYYTGDMNIDGQVTVYSIGGKGKIQPKDSDGLAYYYTAIPADQNFTFRATVTIDEWTYSNGQEGFGLLAMDSLPEHGAAIHWTNQYMAMLGKVEYFYDFAENEIVSAANDNTIKYSMKLGLGVLPKLGITPENIDKVLNMDSETVLQVATGITYPLDLTAAEQNLPKDNYNIVGNATNPDSVPTTIAEKTEFILEIQKNNTGYFITYYDAEGNIIGQQKNYDPEALQMLDTENVYVGFFAARNAKATFSDVSVTTIDPEDDLPAEEKPVTYITPSCLIASPTVSNSPEYTLSLNANVAGTAKITADGEVLIEAAPVTGDVRCDIPVTLTKTGTTKFVVEFTPDPEQDLGEDFALANTDPIVTSVNVSYNTNFANQNNLYVAPNGTSRGNGEKEFPLDIYTAVSVVKPGQTIILMEGTYELTRNVLIARGIDGTAEKPIIMVADPEAASRPVLDFSNAAGAEGITAVGSYWYFQGFDVTNTTNGKAGFHVAGHNNTLDQINAYNNGGTGIQISRFQGSDLKSEWPSNNLILNCTAYNNADSGYEDADGFGAKLTIGAGNVFDGCIAYNNADDGWDLYAKVETGSIPSVTIRNCVAYQNGYVWENGELVNAGNGNGFKMGGSNLAGGHKLINSIAFWNKAKGFDSNSCPDIIVENSTAYNNESYNVAFYTNISQNTAFEGTGIISFKDSTIKSGLDIKENLKPKGNQLEGDSRIWNETNYYWDGSASRNNVRTRSASITEVTGDMFVTLDFQGIIRNEDGTINMQGFLELTNAAPADAGARLSGTASGEITITPDPDLENPKTGDEANIMLWAVLLISSAALLGCGVAFRKKF